MAAPGNIEPSRSSDRLDDSPGKSPSGGKSIYGREFWLVFFATFALNCCSNLFALFPIWIVERGGGAGAIGAIIGTGPLFALLMRPYVGPAIDRHGRKTTALWFIALDVVALALDLPVHSLGWPIYAVRAIHGAVDGTARVALFAMVFDLLPARREGEAMAIFSLCGMGPSSIAPMFGEMLIKRFGFGAFFYSALALGLVGEYFGYGPLFIVWGHSHWSRPDTLSWSSRNRFEE